ncbi:alpha/beta fold hydrolase [Marinibacterium profundimaris]|uniref:AB hydrolase-1 domain-containing protein n=1 Tax=Marinibacterium profundimaris TaxID=1679460 RepID=A0A225ND36_9RHOB|nr:alpha/beta hydrolase [Marinibacterium profundimaris]OWU69526.1 hypothetical protein ATO3_22125 [Marinibacterium profundimaris]
MGQGPRQLLALHCTLAQASAWKGVAARLDRIARLTAFDMPGHGRSADWDGQGDYLETVAGIAAGLMEGPMDVVGHSFGATVALWLALTRPELVRSATLIEPVLMCAARGTRALAEHEARLQPTLDALAQGDRATAARRFNAMWADEDAIGWDDLPAPVRAGMTRAIPLVSAAGETLTGDRLGFLAPGRLEGLRCPVQLIRGSDTDPVIGEINDQLAARIPGAENKIIAGAGHMVAITHATQTATEIRAFIDRHPD